MAGVMSLVGKMAASVWPNWTKKEYRKSVGVEGRITYEGVPRTHAEEQVTKGSAPAPSTMGKMKGLLFFWTNGGSEDEREQTPATPEDLTKDINDNVYVKLETEEAKPPATRVAKRCISSVKTFILNIEKATFDFQSAEKDQLVEERGPATKKLCVGSNKAAERGALQQTNALENKNAIRQERTEALKKKNQEWERKVQKMKRKRAEKEEQVMEKLRLKSLKNV